MVRIAYSLALVAVLAAPAAAQSGRLSGSVRDESGGVLPAVDVRATLRDGSGETTRSVSTDAKGSYDLSGLAPGAWVLTMSLPGFETATQRFNVQQGDSLEWNPTLEVGTLQETVTVTSGISAEPERRQIAVPPPPAPIPSPTRAPAGAIRVGGSIKAPQKIVHVSPVYPADAAAGGISGVVILRAMIGADGMVQEVTTLRSPNDSLTFAATSAVTGWQFTPTLLNGTPVPVRMSVTVNFQPQQQ